MRCSRWMLASGPVVPPMNACPPRLGDGQSCPAWESQKLLKAVPPWAWWNFANTWSSGKLGFLKKQWIWLTKKNKSQFCHKPKTIPRSIGTCPQGRIQNHSQEKCEHWSSSNNVRVLIKHVMHTQDYVTKSGLPGCPLRSISSWQYASVKHQQTWMA